MPQLPLQGRTAVVTGSRRGIGLAIAEALAREGARIVLHGYSAADSGEDSVKRIRALGGEAIYIRADISDPQQRSKLVQAAWHWQSRVDIWINNAGADVLTGRAAEWSFEEKLQRLWQVDVVGTIAMSREVGQKMQQQAAGESLPVIVNMGWDQVEIGMAGDSGEMFSAIKGAIMAFSRSLAASLAPDVRVNCLAPGWIRTAWGEDASPYWQRRACNESLLQRWGCPEDVAAAAVFLASPAADFVTGQTLQINGGWRRES